MLEKSANIFMVMSFLLLSSCVLDLGDSESLKNISNNADQIIHPEEVWFDALNSSYWYTSSDVELFFYDITLDSVVPKDRLIIFNDDGSFGLPAYKVGESSINKTKDQIFNDRISVDYWIIFSFLDVGNQTGNWAIYKVSWQNKAQYVAVTVKDEKIYISDVFETILSVTRPSFGTILLQKQ